MTAALTQTMTAALSANVNPHLQWNLIEDVRQLFDFTFMRNALAAGTIVAVLAAVVGWFMVLRRQSFVGHTLSVVGFPGAAGAVWLGLSASLGYFTFCVAAALVLAALSRETGVGERHEESALVGVLQAFALACGLLFVSLYKGFLGGVTGLLFGNFLGITNGQVISLLVLAVLALLTLAFIGRPLFFASIDAGVAAARGLPTRLLSTAFLLILAITAAEVSQITGALLVFALLVMPAAAAQRLTADPRLSLLLSIVLALLVTWLGLGVAYFSVYPIGFYVTTFGFGAFALATGWQWTRERLGRRAHTRPAMS